MGNRLFYLIPLIMGIVPLVIGVRMLRRVITSKKWPTTMGKVLSSEIPHGLRAGGEAGMAKVLYEYSVYGKVYSSKRVCFGDYNANLGECSRAEAILRKYPKGRSVVVHYNPNKPHIAVLEPGVGSIDYGGRDRNHSAGK